MEMIINGGAALVTDAHAAQGLARLPANRNAAGGAGLQDGRGHGGAFAYLQVSAVDLDREGLAQDEPLFPDCLYWIGCIATVFPIEVAE
jgi:hypothetical protein